MTFQSILFVNCNNRVELDNVDAPAFFVDLNLDQVVDAITARKQEYNLKPFFYSPLHDTDTIHYRQEVARDLEIDTVAQSIKSFAEKMALVRRQMNMISKLYFENHRQGWYLESAVVYCHAVSQLANELSKVEISSRGLLAFREYINLYTQSSQFLTLMADSTSLRNKLSTIRYCIIIKGTWVRVRKYEDEIDYSKEVEKTFEKFKQGDVKNYRIDLTVSSGMNHVEAQILDCVARLFPEIFKELEQFCKKYDGFLDETIRNFDREIQFYIAYLDFIANIKEMGLRFCYPQVSTQNKDIHAEGAFDIALANKRLRENNPVVCNGFYLKTPERIIIVSGPNQGGKTTFARMFGQVHYLCSLGLPIPGTEAQLFISDNIFTHFEKEEDIRNLRGKLQDELVRIRVILEQASSNSIIIMNEIFTSTTLKDAVFLSKQIMQRIIQLDAISVCVSFIDELSVLSEKTVSMVSTIVPENPALRTFRIIRKPADGLSYAICIAEKHRLTYDLIKERIAQ